MSFYLRKSIKVGPVRFNLSKSGIGVSGGVKGFRVGTGPKGNYIHMGRGCIYYRKTLGGGKKRGATGAQQRLYQEPIPSGRMTPPEIPEGRDCQVASALPVWVGDSDRSDTRGIKTPVDQGRHPSCCEHPRGLRHTTAFATCQRAEAVPRRLHWQTAKTPMFLHFIPEASSALQQSPAHGAAIAGSEGSSRVHRAVSPQRFHRTATEK